MSTDCPPRLAYDSSSMWDKYQRLTVNRDHAIVITRTYAAGDWFGAGPATLAPLYRKRHLLIERAGWVHAWTMYNDKLETSSWLTPPNINSTLHFNVELRVRKAGGWYFVIPEELRQKAWLPESGGTVIYEWNEAEVNFWTQAAYDEESTLEADAV